MQERPILLNGEMVRATLDDRKTKTRRVIKPQPDPHLDAATVKSAWDAGFVQIECPYGMPGDLLWVRESIGRRPASFLGIEATNGVESSYYLADGEDVVDDRGFNLCPWFKRKVCPSIHMPRFASRITLRITSVTVERLQDINEEDAQAEGLLLSYAGKGQNSYRDGFQRLWKSINGADSWYQNPWVWVIEFERVKP